MNEQHKNTARQIYLPMVLAAVLIAGMFIGRITNPSGNGSSGNA
ncbi:hypothetical protein [Marinilabilia salmonicolor]|nr:hypothetical protein [Marinilabilia salmonicolor]